MSILIDENTKLLVQGITGRDGLFHTERMIEYGTKVVGGVTPGKGGTEAAGVPVFDTVAEAAEATGANASIIFVPVKFAADAVYEAIGAGLALVVIITEGIPVDEMNRIYHYAHERGTRFVGPNCPGLISPGKCKVGIMPARIHEPGDVGVVSRSGTLTYEVVYALTRAGLGQSTCVGIGGDAVIGTGFLDCLELFEADAGTGSVVLIGEIGGDDEERAADFVQANMTKPVVSFIAGRTAPPGKRMGHAGAIISGGAGTAEGKRQALLAAGVGVADTPSALPDMLKKALGKA
ncbi:MAG: succinate--CoA ligase subunit alpha [Candidatus Coatesbacteria bacterium]|nr:MAG: succinate--CoA ligase subunit alpha [Candidatus Coatesbacteria bacterium]